MCAFAYHRDIEREVERDERKIRQVDVMNLTEDLLPHARICRGLFLSKELVQGGVAVEVKVESIKVISCRWKLVAGKQAGIIRVVGKKVLS